jgi:hypothetical protein
MSGITVLQHFSCSFVPRYTLSYIKFSGCALPDRLWYDISYITLIAHCMSIAVIIRLSVRYKVLKNIISLLGLSCVREYEATTQPDAVIIYSLYSSHVDMKSSTMLFKNRENTAA